MAQMILTLCDLCSTEAAEDSVSPDLATDKGDPYVLTLEEGAAPRVIDLCPMHAHALLAELQAALDAHGRRLPAPAAPARKPAGQGAGVGRPPSTSGGPFACIVCGHRTGSGSGLVLHAQAHHDLQGAHALYGAGPTVCPLCGDAKATALGVAQHARRDHGVEEGDGAVHRAWAMAMDQGDPVGAVAKRRAELGLQLL